MEQPPSNDNAAQQLLVKEDGLWLYRPGEDPEWLNLGDPHKFFALAAEASAQIDD